MSSTDDLPDIYYIILDMYAREDTLRKLLDYDNSEFVDYLTDKGFYVADKSHSNYTTSYLSVSSSLNMAYESQGSAQLDKIKKIEDNTVSQLLGSVEYHYVYVSGGMPLSNMKKYAEVYSYSGVFGIEVSNFAQGLCDTTMLSPLARYFGGLYGVNSILYAFDAIVGVSDIKGPTFCYSHILCPHPPWLFNDDGPRESSMLYQTDIDTQLGYLDNLEFVNKKVMSLVDSLLSKPGIPPIIILQGDHGLWWVEEYEQHFEILNAYYLPSKGSKLLYSTISPVNSFRLILNSCFDANYALLEDYMVNASENVWIRLEEKK